MDSQAPFQLWYLPDSCVVNPLASYNFQDGDVVYCRRRKRVGTLVGKRTQEKESATSSLPMKEWNILFRQQSNAAANTNTPQVLSSRSKPLPLSPVMLLQQQDRSRPTVVLARSTSVYRLWALAVLELQYTSAVVLEIGCSTGATSCALQKAAAGNATSHTEKPVIVHLTCFDTSTEMIATTKNVLTAHDNSSFTFQCYCIDALSSPTVAKEYATTTTNGLPNIILLDIGGNRELAGVVRMLEWIFGTLYANNDVDVVVKSPIVIVKSETMVDVWEEMYPNTASTKDTNAHLSTDSLHTLYSQDKVNAWWKQCQAKSTRDEQRVYTLHPLKAPLRKVLQVNDDTNCDTDDSKSVICRYHNYHQDGCKRYKTTQQCPYNHQHCHACLQQGHIARQCKQGIL